jgi:hypothetical protein
LNRFRIHVISIDITAYMSDATVIADLVEHRKYARDK